MALGAIFGALSGLADFGEQRADASQQAADELYRRQLQKQQTQQFQTTQQEAQLRAQELRQRIQLEQQKIPGKTFTGPGGKQYGYFTSPVSGQTTIEEIPGPAAETSVQADMRALKESGLFTDEQIGKMIQAQYEGRTPSGTRVGYQPDPKNPGMAIATVYGYDGSPLYSYSTVAPASSQPTVTETTGTDLFGNQRHETTIRGKLAQMLNPPRFPAPQLPLMASGGFTGAPAVPQATTPPQPVQTPQGAPQGAAAPQGLPPLDQNGLIPPQPGLNENIRGLANRVIVNPGTAVPAAAQGQVDNLISKYYPNFVGKLPPASIAMILKVDPVIKQVDRLMGDIEKLKLTNNNQPAYLLGSRAKYALGMASPENTLGHDIAGLSLGSLVEAASALAGASRAMPALDIAMEHTPKVWKDSPKQIYTKLKEIRQRLSDMESIARNPYAGLSDPSAGANTPPPGAKVRDFSQLGP